MLNLSNSRNPIKAWRDRNRQWRNDGVRSQTSVNGWGVKCETYDLMNSFRHEEDWNDDVEVADSESGEAWGLIILPWMGWGMSGSSFWRLNLISSRVMYSKVWHNPPRVLKFNAPLANRLWLLVHLKYLVQYYTQRLEPSPSYCSRWWNIGQEVYSTYPQPTWSSGWGRISLGYVVPTDYNIWDHRVKWVMDLRVNTRYIMIIMI